MKNWVRKHPIITGLLLLALVLHTALYVAEVIWFKSLIPDAIETSWPIAIDGETGLLSACGSASFTLTEKTLSEIEKKGLAFFENAKEAEPWRPFEERSKIRGYRWSKGPVWDGVPRDSGYKDLVGCDSSFNLNKLKEIGKTAATSEAYYTEPRESGRLLVLPSLKMIIFVYRQ